MVKAGFCGSEFIECLLDLIHKCGKNRFFPKIGQTPSQAVSYPQKGKSKLF